MIVCNSPDKCLLAFIDILRVLQSSISDAIIGCVVTYQNLNSG